MDPVCVGTGIGLTKECRSCLLLWRIATQLDTIGLAHRGNTNCFGTLCTYRVGRGCIGAETGAAKLDLGVGTLWIIAIAC